jgi:hypothetical protein
MSVTISGVGERKQFNAICPISKFVVTKTYKNATSLSGRDFFLHIQKNMPFPILSAQVDGGAKFMDEFEKAFKKEDIPLFVVRFTTSFTKN